MAEASEQLTPGYVFVDSDELQGDWLALHYQERGMTVSFDHINSSSVDDASSLPMYAIDTTVDNRQSDGLFLVTNGCLVDVSGFAGMVGKVAASSEMLEEVPLSWLMRKGVIVPLNESTDFWLPDQAVKSPFKIGYKKKETSPNNRRIRSMEIDLHGFGIRSKNEATESIAKITDESMIDIDLGNIALLNRHRHKLPFARIGSTLREALLDSRLIQRPGADEVKGRKVLDLTTLYVAQKLQEL